MADVEHLPQNSTSTKVDTTPEPAFTPEQEQLRRAVEQRWEHVRVVSNQAGAKRTDTIEEKKGVFRTFTALF